MRTPRKLINLICECSSKVGYGTMVDMKSKRHIHLQVIRKLAEGDKLFKR